MINAPVAARAVQRDTEFQNDFQKTFNPAGDSMPPGKQTLLVAAMQSKNNARCTVSGSLDLFSDEYYNAQLTSGGTSGNRNFGASISAWTLGETGVVKLLELTYGVEGSSEKNPKVHKPKPEALNPKPCNLE
jgi:oligosaccharyltransferase complex subunit beta